LTVPLLFFRLQRERVKPGHFENRQGIDRIARVSGGAGIVPAHSLVNMATVAGLHVEMRVREVA